jgi:hypothetical protein
MMYRAGWGDKDDAQRRILAIDITRKASRGHLRKAARAIRTPACPLVLGKRSNDERPRASPHRTIQIGPGGEAVDRYVGERILRIEDVTEQAHAIHALARSGRLDEAGVALLKEVQYPD